MPDNSQVPKFAQIYIHDTDYELNNRHLQMNNLSKCLLMELQTMIHQYNPFVRYFKSAYSCMKEKNGTDVQMIMRADKNTDLRRYNTPTNSEIAVILPLENNIPISGRDIILYQSSGGIKKINSLNALYDPLHYVLLFPFGDPGFQLDLSYNNSNTDCDRYTEIGKFLNVVSF